MRDRHTARTLLAMSLLAVVTLALTQCTTNPATGKKQLTMLSTQQEIQIGEEATPQLLEQGGGPIPSQPINDYVSQIGRRLVESAVATAYVNKDELRALPWEFHTLDSEVINAFALPGGKIFITRGLMAKMTNEAQLAGVLGHEIAHVLAEHADQRITQAVGLEVLLAVLAGQSDQQWVPAVVGTGGQLYLLRYNRDQEDQADELGVKYMVHAGYDPMGQVQVMQILKQASGGGGGIEWLQTHPLPENRIDDLKKLIRNNYAYALDNPSYIEGQQRFEQTVLDRLARLPEPQQQQQQP